MGCFDTLLIKNNPRILQRLNKVFNTTGDFDYMLQTKSLGSNLKTFTIDESGNFTSTSCDCSKFSGKFIAYNSVSQDVWIDVLITINNGKFVDLVVADLRVAHHSIIKSNVPIIEDLSKVANIKRKR